MEVFINGTSEGVFRPDIHGLLIVYGQDGNDTINFLVPSRAVLAYGNDGNDTINSGNNSGMLLGGDNDDELVGGNSGDLLIGGRGADTARGNNGKDILVAGFTDFDVNTPAAQAALCDIRDGASLLTTTTAHDDSDIDVLLGGNGKDAFFLNLSGGTALDTSDATGGEVVTDLL
jgi:Ca2+-binding RTX toxin-like protein